MRLLVLGGTHHVGRAFVEAALARGDEVTTVTRGVSGTPVPGAEARHADRLDADALRMALGDDEWDAVVDTWSAAPVAVQTSARLLRRRAAHYTYISSCSVYTWPIEPGSDEGAPVVEGDPSSTDGRTTPRPSAAASSPPMRSSTATSPSRGPGSSSVRTRSSVGCRSG